MTPKTLFALDNLQNAVANVFSQVQVSCANHKKNCVNLYKLHAQAAGHIESNNWATVNLVGEDAFVRVLCDMMTRVLTIKKGVASADRTARFIGSYLKYINERGSSTSGLISVHQLSRTYSHTGESGQVCLHREIDG